MVVRFYSSVAPETTLSAGITNAATSITVGSVTGFPSNTPYTLALDYEGLTEELVQVNNAAGTTLTVARAVDGTSAASHNAGARVRHVSSARDFADSRSHENTGNGVHGLAGGEVIVGTTSVQTLTNKTFTNPTINNATISGIWAGSPTFQGTWTGDTAAKFRFNNTTDVSLVSVNHAFQVGLDSGSNIRMDNNEIMAVTNGAATNLILNAEGGVVTVNGGLAQDNAALGISAFAGIDVNLLQIGRTSASSVVVQAKADADAQQRFTVQADGGHAWGTGAAPADTTLVRSGSARLTVGSNLTVTSNVTSGTLNTTTGTVTNLNNSNGISYQPTQSAIVPISFTSQTSFTQVVNFPVAFPATPAISINIASGAGETLRWGARAISASATQFTILVFSGDATDPTRTWSNIPVHWTATQI